VTKVAVFRANGLRHKALSTRLRMEGFQVFDLVEEKKSENQHIQSELLVNHFRARNESERSFFESDILNFGDFSMLCETDDINNQGNLDKIYSFDPAYIVIFGTRILKKVWLDAFPGRFLGIHLGISPYYRGSGTNFFPFVNKELGAVGFTLMALDEGVDTGAILHQKRATFEYGDDFHTVGNRLISSMFLDITSIIRQRYSLTLAKRQPTVPSKYYKKSDFTEDKLLTAYRNIASGLIKDYVRNKSHEDSLFPLIQELPLE